MSLADDLLDTARRLAATTGPTGADIRRAVSTAYYALFHRLIEAAGAALVPAADQQQALARRFSHTEMKKVCQLVFKSPVPPFAVPFFGSAPTADLVTVAKAFVDLQERRHAADYDTGTSLTPSSASDAVQDVQDAFDAFARLTPVTTQPFLVLLLVGEPKPPR